MGRVSSEFYMNILGEVVYLALFVKRKHKKLFASKSFGTPFTEQSAILMPTKEDLSPIKRLNYQFVRF